GARGPGTDPQAGGSDPRQDHGVEAARPGERARGRAGRRPRPHRPHPEGARGNGQEEEGDRGEREGRRPHDQRKAGRQDRREAWRQGEHAMKAPAWLTVTASRVACVLLPAAFAACATPPKPPELQAYDLLRQTANLQEANKRSPDLVAGAEKLAD